MAITSAISDLFASFYELIASIFGTAYSLVAAIVNAVVGFISGIFTLAGDVLQGMINVVGGLGKFVLGNIFLISVGAIGAVLYMRYTASGQKTVKAA